MTDEREYPDGLRRFLASVFEGWGPHAPFHFTAFPPPRRDGAAIEHLRFTDRERSAAPPRIRPPKVACMEVLTCLYFLHTQFWRRSRVHGDLQVTNFAVHDNRLWVLDYDDHTTVRFDLAPREDVSLREIETEDAAPPPTHAWARLTLEAWEFAAMSERVCGHNVLEPFGYAAEWYRPEVAVNEMLVAEGAYYRFRWEDADARRAFADTMHALDDFVREHGATFERYKVSRRLDEDARRMLEYYCAPAVPRRRTVRRASGERTSRRRASGERTPFVPRAVTLSRKWRNERRR